MKKKRKPRTTFAKKQGLGPRQIPVMASLMAQGCTDEEISDWLTCEVKWIKWKRKDPEVIKMIELEKGPKKKKRKARPATAKEKAAAAKPPKKQPAADGRVETPKPKVKADGRK